MARPRKDGMDYFPHDTDAVNDEKIEILRMLYGNDGYAFYFITLERIYRTAKFELDLSDIEIRTILTKKIGITPDKFNQILESAIKYGCFDQKMYHSFCILTSNGVKKRADVVVSKREYMRDIRNQPIEEIVSATQTTPQTTPQTPQSKGKESKEKESKVLKNYSVFPALNDAILNFVEFRKKIKKPMTDRAIELMIANLEKLSTDTNIQIQILNRSIMQGWTGLYELKTEPSKKPQKKNNFHNFEAKADEQDIDEILRQKGRGNK